jgi:uncharacterized protein (DUF2126 family)
MGEEGSVGGTVRYVDSSVERVQVKIKGMAPDRYVLTCNGVPVPLQNTGTNGEFVAGVFVTVPGSRHPVCIRPLALIRRWYSTSSIPG